MGEIVNLRRVRRKRDQDEAVALAAENRARHGRTRLQLEIDERDAARRDLLLNQHLLSVCKSDIKSSVIDGESEKFTLGHPAIGDFPSSA